MFDYKILRACENDAEEILFLQKIAYQSEAVLYNDFFIPPLTQTLEQLINEFHSGVVLKAVADNKIIGSVRAFEKDNTVYVGRLIVFPEYQNQGVGKRLLYAIENEFPGKRFELFTGDKSEKNLALYEKCGYTRFKTEAVKPGLTLVYMEKLPINIRRITPSDYPALEDFLYGAVYVPPGVEPPPREIIFDPEIYVYIKDFGSKPGDLGVVAEQNGQIIGMAWTRIIPAYGHIDDDTPELAISVLPECRSKNIGTKMMRRLFELLCEKGYKRTSLSVQKDNPAVRFYERLGYKVTCEKLDHVGHEDYIMVKDLREGLS